jgi:hypothetical protein
MITNPLHERRVSSAERSHDPEEDDHAELQACDDQHKPEADKPERYENIDNLHNWLV